MRRLLRPDDAPNEGVRQLRVLLRRLTSEQLARKAVCDASALRRWARGERTPSAAMRAVLDDVLGIPAGAWAEPFPADVYAIEPPTRRTRA